MLPNTSGDNELASLGNWCVESSFNKRFFDLFLGTAPVFVGICLGDIVVWEAFARRTEEMFL